MDKLPEIEIAASFREMFPPIWDAMEKANAKNPLIFQYGESLVRIVSGNNGALFVETLNGERLMGELDRRMQFMKFDKTSKAYVPARVPDFVVDAVLAEPCDRKHIPLISRIVHFPVFSPDGDLVVKEGYCPKSKMLYAPEKGLAIPPVSENPTSADIKRAKELIFENLLADFPFVSETDKAHAVSMLFAPAIRGMIDGATPAYIVKAPTSGSGKSKLPTCCLMVWYPDIAVSVWKQNEAELEKQLYGDLRRGKPYIFFDNVKHRLDSPSFEAVITSRSYSSRVLGVSECPAVPVYQTFVATGNNLSVGTEMSDRSVPITLDARMQKPSERNGFKHPFLEAWVKAQRNWLIWAVLTLVSNWIQNGKPNGTRTHGRFPEWSQTTGGILKCNEITGFLEPAAMSEFQGASDTESETMEGFVQRWHEEFECREVFARDLASIASELGLAKSGQFVSHEQTVLGTGKYLGSIRDKVCNGFKIKKLPPTKGHTKWALEVLPDPRKEQG